VAEAELMSMFSSAEEYHTIMDISESYERERENYIR
jgi:hypothetical protein